ncbi:MAG TPA: hypothetical protein VJM46_01015 [Candidatus Saccharimonadales bacterium]|nr:hypothetical protein [Candidatus Saccharimonadales bacterium]
MTVCFIFGLALRVWRKQGREDIATMFRAKRFAAQMDRTIQGHGHGHTVDRLTYRIVVAKPSEFTAGKFGLQVRAPDGRIIGVITRQRPVDLYLDNPTHLLAWA